MSERTVQYHLQMLREAGLLAYVRRGTRVRAEGALASEFARMIPNGFDRALGIRTTGEGASRRAVGIAEHGRALMAALARLAAAGRARAPRRTTAVRTSRCTPKGVTTRSLSCADETLPPPESKLADGHEATTSLRQTSRGAARLNKIGRRHQLAGELIREVDWLGRCQAPRIAWMVRHVADAGWTAAEVRAWLHLRGGVNDVRRPSGLLAVLLDGAERVLDTRAKRTAAVEQWRDSRTAARHRHRQWGAASSGPRSFAVRRQVAAALTWSPSRPMSQPVVESAGISLSAADREVLRETARGEFMRGETTLVRSAVDTLGREAAEELYGSALVRRALRLAAGTSRMALGLQGAAAR
ncbi:winged helix-turn-helix domain-containing protein (plasmid) [Streptomyces sp. QH1-20]|uniref:helix-turn-helix domain-containing protein n=1 Tax=Streptomyces sp. QH1-20 TaxID=3240934 RepID=UPI0035138BF6